jgi:SEC-C motif domain protein
MEDVDPSDTCPCGSRRAYGECCGPFHAGADAPTAVELMRSRFSAYALRIPGYVLHTWDPRTSPKGLDLDDGITWRRLQIVDTARGGPDDTEGTVRFRASYRTVDGAGILAERSRFRRHRGRWVYVDGEIIEN